MDSAKRTQIEKAVVIGLLIVFVVALIRTLNLKPFVVKLVGAPPGLGRSVSGVQQVLSATLQTGSHPFVSDAGADNEPPSTLTMIGPPLYTAQSLRDPMKSLFPEHPPQPAIVKESEGSKPNTQIAQMPALEIQGFLWGGPRPSVIINNEVYGVGDLVQGVAIKSITPDGVTVVFLGKERQLGTTATNGERAASPRRKL